MGLRAASVRHSDAVVMAPALTEAGQSKKFSTHPPINNVSQNSSEDVNYCKEPLVSKCTLLTFVNGNYAKLKPEIISTKLRSALEKGVQSQHTIMSTSPTPMADDNTMGIQKVGIDVTSSLPKEKIPPEMEQLLTNLSSDLTNAGDIGHNVDEIMQVIKNMEVDVATGSENIPNETMFPISFERELFGEVDMMMCDDEQLTTSALKETRAKEMIEELQKKQLKLERRSEFLLRRLRKLQFRTMGQHVSDEIAGLFEHVHRSLRNTKENYKDSFDMFNSIADDDTIDREELKPLDNQSMKNLIRKIEMSTILHSSHSRQRYVSKYFGSGSSEAKSTVSYRGNSNSVPTLGTKPREELERVSGLLRSQMLILEKQLDSDATASSSGGESCDEMQSFNNQHQQYLSINKRASWRYANERAAVASRWTWLQAQISDLEYRIRQHNELHRQIRNCKGAVTLGEPSPPHSQPTSPSAVNGYRGQLPGATGKSTPDDTVNGTLPGYGSARTRPLHRGSFRKRKLLQTTGLHTVSKKAGRPSNIRCGCVPSVVPCALCTGRTDPTFPRDLSDQVTVTERVALLDPGFHPVLSFNNDVSQSIHLDAIMKLQDWQQKSLRSSVKTYKSIPKHERSNITTNLDNRTKKSEQHRKYSRLLKNNPPNVLGIKKKIRGRKPFSRNSSMSRVSKKRHIPRVMVTQLQYGSENVDEEMEDLNMIASAGKGESLTPSPLSHIQVPYRRNRVNSYDIDNIVIPYSVAASTRVEKLQYKEILTPKWRIIDDEFPAKYDEVKNNGFVRRVSEDSDVEDVNDDTIAARHDKCEHDEKKKFLSYIKFPLTGGRSRANRRTDSRAESSGANTPDPMSPYMGEPSDIAGSPITSPPATPLSVTTEEASPNTLRRRTVSQSRWVKDREENVVGLADHVEVTPYEHRTFPLGDEVYDKMLKHMPEGHPLPAYLNKQSSKDSDVADSVIDSRAVSPVSDSTESAIADEDPNDPEWLSIEKIRDRTKR